MRECDNIRESMERWLDGELEAGKSESVRAHLTDCAQCREIQRQLEAVQVVLKDALIAEAHKIEFLPFWRVVQVRIGQKAPWYEQTLDWARGVFTGYRAAWVIPATIAVLLAVLSLQSYIPGWWRDPRNSFATVESIDSYGRNVALLRENESKTTVIWLYEDQEGENGTADDSTKSAPAF